MLESVALYISILQYLRIVISYFHDEKLLGPNSVHSVCLSAVYFGQHKRMVHLSNRHL
jgi:hypothetical protein